MSVKERASCQSCRFKACIARGMDIHRLERADYVMPFQIYVSKMSKKLIYEFEQLDRQLSEKINCKWLFDQFFRNCMYPFNIANEARFISLFSDSPNKSGPARVKEPLNTITLFVFEFFFYTQNRFNIKCNSSLREFLCDLNLIRYRIMMHLERNNFSHVMRIICFLYTYNLIEHILCNGTIEDIWRDPKRQRIEDLLRSECLDFVITEKDLNIDELYYTSKMFEDIKFSNFFKGLLMILFELYIAIYKCVVLYFFI